MSHRSRASVISQTTIQPLILAVATNSPTSMSASRQSSFTSKRDSLEPGVGIGPRGSQMRRPFSEADMAPTYRLVRSFFVVYFRLLCEEVWLKTA